VLELDHVFCFVADPLVAARRLEDDGWLLDAGQAHAGQGTRNRRLVWSGRFFELVWLTDEAEARANPLRLDRRAAWRATGASPVGLGFRGRLDPERRDDFWLYDALGPRIHVHRDNERAPERPLVFVLEATGEEMAQRQARMSKAGEHHRPRELREIRVRAPSAPCLPPFAAPPIACVAGPHHLELVVDEGGLALPICDGLSICR
jgi:hypothetical protein